MYFPALAYGDKVDIAVLREIIPTSYYPRNSAEVVDYFAPISISPDFDYRSIRKINLLQLMAMHTLVLNAREQNARITIILTKTKGYTQFEVHDTGRNEKGEITWTNNTAPDGVYEHDAFRNWFKRMLQKGRVEGINEMQLNGGLALLLQFIGYKSRDNEQYSADLPTEKAIQNQRTKFIVIRTPNN